MSRLPKPNSPAVSTPTSPAELAQKIKFLPQGDSRALAASSTAIALSIASPFYDTRYTPSDRAPIQGRNAGWQTAYGAARIAVEISKESSDMFLPLKAVVGAMSALMKNCDQTADNTGSVKEIERRVQSLASVLASPVSEDDCAEKGRRIELRRTLEGVLAKLEPLSDQHILIKFLHNIDNTKTLMGFVQELAEAVTDYQVSMQQGMYERTKNIRNDTKNILGAADLEILAKLEPVRNAGHQAGHHNRCLPGTRESVLQDIMLWAKNPQDQNVFWLNGLAGTGKSTIAQSFSEMVAKEGILGASFFCSRDYLDRKELKNIFPTLAYQLACHYPHFRSHVITTLKEDPTLAHTSLISQLENLLVDPLSGKNVSCIIVIDALDECIDDQPASAILSVLGRFVKQLPLVKFFITGRPEPRIRTGFRLPLLEPLTQIFLLHEVELSSVDKDIQLYLTQRLTTIAKQRSGLDLPNPWPHNDEIVALTKKSSGLFIFASTLARFIESEHHEPDERLQLVLSDANNTMHEGRAGIDTLYSQILLHAFSDVQESTVFVNMRHVLGAIVLAFNPLSRRELSTILGTPMSLISTTLRHLHSVILIPTDEAKEIRIFHKSFPDFLQDGKRCTDPRFHIKPETYHSQMALSCLELMKKLKRNPCSLPPYIMNQSALVLPELLEKELGGAMRYVCSYWARHLELSPTYGSYHTRVVLSAAKMLRSAPLWIEVMSLESHLERVIHSMNSLLAWLEKANGKASFLYTLATDCLRLVMHFFHPIQQCAQHLYHTALPLSPTSSPLHKFYLQSIRDNQLSHVVSFSGAPRNWGLLLRTIDIRPRQLTCITTSTQRIIAACGDTVNIYDAATFVLQQSLSTPGIVRKIQCSPDGSILFFAHSISITMWDVQTGGLIHTFTVQAEISDIAVSPTGTPIACGLFNGSVTFWETYTKKEGVGFGNGQPVITIHWLSLHELAVATQDSVYVYDFDVGGISSSFSISSHVWGMVYSVDKDVDIGLNEDGDDKDRNVPKGRFMVGTSLPDQGGLVSQKQSCFLRITKPKKRHILLEQLSVYLGGPQGQESPLNPSPAYLGQLSSPTLVGKEIACITSPSGVQSFDIISYDWTNNPPLLGAATSVAISLNRNLVAQTKDSIQIFSIDVLTSGGTHNNIHPSHIYPLGKNHIICFLQPSRHLTLLELETLQELHPDDGDIPLLGSLLVDKSASARASSGRGLLAEFGVSFVMQKWQSGAPLPEWTEAADEDAPLRGWSPKCTRVVAIHNSPQPELRVEDAKSGVIIAALPLQHDELRMGKIYDLIFNSEARFYVKIDGPGWRVQIPHDVLVSPWGGYSHRIIKGEPVTLSEPRPTPPYTLDANCEWVVDAESRKICWISPGDLRRGNGGHFWAGLSLVMVGGDGIVRKLTFKEPDC